MGTKRISKAPTIPHQVSLYVLRGNRLACLLMRLKGWQLSEKDKGTKLF